MIFVSLGTTHFPFNRMVDAIERITTVCNDTIIIQYGYTTWFLDKLGDSQQCVLISFLNDQQVGMYLSQSRISIIQAGEGSWIRARESCDSPPLVVPRDPRFHEHVDDQQLLLAATVQSQALVVTNPDTLSEVVRNYEVLASKMAWKRRSQIVNAQLIDLLNRLVSV